MALKKVSCTFEEKDVESVKTLAEKYDVPQAVLYRAGVKLILKMKVADQKALLKKK